MIALARLNGELVEVNPAFEACRRMTPGARSLYDMLAPGERIPFRDWVAKAYQMGQLFRERYNLLLGDHQETCFDCLLLPLPEEQFLFVAEEIISDPNLTQAVQRMSRQVKLFKVESAQAKQIAINKQVEVDAIMAQTDEIKHIDPLTFMPNRRLLMKALQSEVIRSDRYKTPLSISMLDVDHFKNINDVHGHTVGDAVLGQIATYLRDHIRHPDTAGRYGGEEFLILLPNTSIKFASEQAARLCREISKLKIKAGTDTVQLTVSIGIAELNVGSETWQKLLNRADKAMYQAKEQGRNRFVAIENQAQGDMG
jgi:diguanylate cyclase (GGDEF)-like protein